MDDELFAKNMKYLRKINNLKQDDLAERLYVTSQAVSKWETGKSIPDIKLLLSIASLFNVKVEDLLQVDLENQTPEIEQEDVEITTPKEEQTTRNVFVLEHESKEYKVFFISLLVFFGLCATYIPVFFFEYDFITFIGLFVQVGCLIALFVYELKIALNLKEVSHMYLKTTIRNRAKTFKICVPLLMLTTVISTTLLILHYIEINIKFFYIYLIAINVLVIIDLMINYIFYEKVIDDSRWE